MIKFEDKMHNTKLYPIYKMFGTDLLFFYAIAFIFYTQIKFIVNIQMIIILLFLKFVLIFVEF